ncbi:MAG: hypothetical protein M1587_08755 [Thaumarchaeota archaeon]|nr:hypothetical protein [Nitrososphaerota archaeon]
MRRSQSLIAKEPDESGYSEKKITDIQELKLLVWGMDLDEGIRFVTEIPGYKEGAYVFLTRSEGKFIANVKERVFDESSKNYLPGSKEEWKYFDRPNEAWSFVTKFLGPKFEVFYY